MGTISTGVGWTVRHDVAPARALRIHNHRNVDTIAPEPLRGSARKSFD